MKKKMRTMMMMMMIQVKMITKIGTKPYARSRRNELIELTGCWTGRWRKVTGRSD